MCTRELRDGQSGDIKRQNMSHTPLPPTSSQALDTNAVKTRNVTLTSPKTTKATLTKQSNIINTNSTSSLIETSKHNKIN